MDKQIFLKHTKALAEKQAIGFKIDDILGSDISCEGFLGELVNDYGDLILNVVTNGKEIPDDIFEKFWNYIVNPDVWSDVELEVLYEELISL